MWRMPFGRPQQSVRAHILRFDARGAVACIHLARALSPLAALLLAHLSRRTFSARLRLRVRSAEIRPLDPLAAALVYPFLPISLALLLPFGAHRCPGLGYSGLARLGDGTLAALLLALNPLLLAFQALLPVQRLASDLALLLTHLAPVEATVLPHVASVDATVLTNVTPIFAPVLADSAPVLTQILAACTPLLLVLEALLRPVLTLTVLHGKAASAGAVVNPCAIAGIIEIVEIAAAKADLAKAKPDIAAVKAVIGRIAIALRIVAAAITSSVTSAADPDGHAAIAAIISAAISAGRKRDRSQCYCSDADGAAAAVLDKVELGQSHVFLSHRMCWRGGPPERGSDNLFIQLPS